MSECHEGSGRPIDKPVGLAMQSVHDLEAKPHRPPCPVSTPVLPLSHKLWRLAKFGRGKRWLYPCTPYCAHAFASTGWLLFGLSSKVLPEVLQLNGCMQLA
jgi:hypothetical protein